jgi:hypothetical protein
MPELHIAVPQDRFGAYEGGGWEWCKTDYAVNREFVGDRTECRPIAAITDGLSNTVILGEKAFDPSIETEKSWYWDEPFMLGGSKGTSRSGLAIIPDGPGISFKENWGSCHRGGALFLFADGAVHLLPFHVDLAVVGAMLSPAGGDIFSPPW